MQAKELYSFHNVTTARVFSIVVVAIGALVWTTRFSTGVAVNPLAEFVSAIRIILMGLALVWVRPLADRFIPRRASVVVLVGTILLLFLPWGLQQLLPEIAARVLIDTMFASIACFGVICGIRSHPTKDMTKRLFFGCLIALVFFTVLTGKGYITPFVFENTLLGIQHHDTLYHASIAGMIEFHDKVSVGIDGVVPVAYHTLNHRLVGAVANWLDIPVLHALYLLVMIVTIPLLFKFLCDAVFALKPNGWPPLSPIPALVFFLCWPMGFSLLQPSAYYSSESYILSLLIMFLTIPVMAELSVEKSGRLALLMYAFTFSLAIAFAASAKISTGAVMATGLAGFFILAGRFSASSFVSAVVFCIAPFIFVFSSVVSKDAQSSSLFSPLHFLFEWREPALFHIFLVVITGVVIWKFSQWRERAGNVTTALYGMALAALGSSLLVKLEAGAAMFFANPAMWICILLLAALLPTPEWPKNVTPNAQFLIAILLFVGLSALEKDRWKSFDAVETVSINSQDQSQQTKLLNAGLVSQVEKTVAEYGRGFLVFVGPEFNSFWTQKDLCWTQSFVIPALTSQPMLKGLPPKKLGCEITKNYGFPAYDEDNSRSVSLSDSDLCAATLKRGYSAVLKLSHQNAEYIECRS